MRANDKVTNPSISIVVVAAPNRRKNLSRCLSSIRNSNYPNKETIVVDNSNNPRLAQEVSLIFPEVTLIRMPMNTGVLGYNIGFANARGEYIVALDDDCALKPNTLLELSARLQQTPKNVGILDFNWFNPLGGYYHMDSTQPPKLKDRFSFGGGACIFKKEIFQKVGYFDSDFFLWVHEEDLALRVLAAGYKIRFAEDIVIKHFEPKNGFRPQKIFYNARNKAWLRVKHFSLRYFPLLIVRDLIWLLLLPYRWRSLRTLYYGFIGYLSGWLTFWVQMKKRKVISTNVQKNYLTTSVFSGFDDIWQNIRQRVAKALDNQQISAHEK